MKADSAALVLAAIVRPETFGPNPILIESVISVGTEKCLGNQ
jgi:hypothetical protein